MISIAPGKTAQGALLVNGSDEKSGGEKSKGTEMFPNFPRVLGPSHLEFIGKSELHTQEEVVSPTRPKFTSLR